jgi:hypothetical protein
VAHCGGIAAASGHRNESGSQAVFFISIQDKESAMATRVNDHVEISTRESRQGEGSKRVAWVLRASLVLAVIAGVAVYFSFFPL